MMGIPEFMVRCLEMLVEMFGNQMVEMLGTLEVQLASEISAVLFGIMPFVPVDAIITLGGQCWN